MDSTTQWSISWTTALLPPQEMLPPESLFSTLSYARPTATNSEYLFGFTPCIPSFCSENSTIVSSEDDTTDIQSINNAYEGYGPLQRVLLGF